MPSAAGVVATLGWALGPSSSTRLPRADSAPGRAASFAAHMSRILVLQHIGCEPPGAYGDELDERGISPEIVHLDAGEELPDWALFDAIIAMGGPMGAYEEAIHPWLAAEKQLIAEAVRAGTPFWGVCLGAQLLAASLGAPVLRGPLPEVGVLPVELTAAAAGDPVFAPAPASFPALHWHGDTYELPAGAVQLARSHAYEQQAFAYGGAYALQFHLEASTALVADWGRVPAYAAALAALVPAEQSIGALIERLGAVESAATALARELFARWLVHVVGV